ncbi:MAG: ABC transporter ATP-binding protein [Myxococcota bacterium]
MSEQGLVISNLSKTYRNGVRALDRVSFSVSPGLYGLLGPNGAGKSTLMRTLATLQRPDEGSVFLDGVEVLQDADYLRNRLGYLPQSIAPYPGVTATQLLTRFAWLKGRTNPSIRKQEVTHLLARVSLSEHANRLLSTYSGGMLRRFGIAVALVASPRLIIVDEPTAGLDPEERNRFHRILADVASHAVVLLSTHIVEDIENVCTRLAILNEGRIVAEGKPTELQAPLKGRLWSRVVPRNESLPDALHMAARPQGTKVVVLGDHPPSAAFSAHSPTLEDAYYVAVAESRKVAA